MEPGAHRLVPVAEMPEIEGLQVPGSFYWLLRQPVSLAGMAFPAWDAPWRTLHGLGFRHIVCLTGSSPGYDPSPLRQLCMEALEDLHHGREPRNPAREEELSHKAIDLIGERLSAGEGVVVHCAGGTGRTGTVLGCVLKSLGYATDEVVGHMRALSEARGKRPGWPESPWQQQLVERYPGPATS